MSVRELGKELLMAWLVWLLGYWIPDEQDCLSEVCS